MSDQVRMVQCVVLKREAPGLDRLPYPGDLGARIWRSVSKEGWERWVAHQTMLINEYRLTPVEPKARKFLEAEMEKFLFGEGAVKPEGYVDPGAVRIGVLGRAYGARRTRLQRRRAVKTPWWCATSTARRLRTGTP